MLQKSVRHIILLSGILFSTIGLWAQNIQNPNCALTLQGRILDDHDQTGLSYARIFVEDAELGVLTDEKGQFQLDDLCPGRIHLQISHVNCETKRVSFELRKDTLLAVYMEHHTHELATVTIAEQRSGQPVGAASQSLTAQELEQLQGKELGEIAAQLPGVNQLKTASGFSKPIINGLYGQRILLTQQGLPQAGQLWSPDHAPEIDPALANRLTVIKGAATVRYGNQAQGGVLSLSDAPMPTDEHPHGMLQAITQSNGRQIKLIGRLEGGLANIPAFTWRIQGSGSLSGDQHSPTYSLTNTGHRTGSMALTLAYQLPKWKWQAYISHFRTEFGILRGAHIGNLTDLYAALERDVPWFTKDFSYQIENPRQEVAHTFARGQVIHYPQQGHTLTVKYGFQYNRRKEYDIRRAGRSAIPATNLKLTTQQLQAVYAIKRAAWQLEGGLHYQYQSNANVSGTGIRPLLPNYIQYLPAVYTLVQHQANRLKWEVGARLTYQYLRVRKFTRQRELIQPLHTGLQPSLTAGVNINLRNNLTWRVHAGLGKRPPFVHELYSEGLHHVSASIEEGDTTLVDERFLNVNQSLTWEVSDRIYAEASVYVHRFDGYMYLDPQAEPRLTIQGSFPVFNYAQADALLWGGDVSTRVRLWRALYWESQFSYVYGQQLELEDPLPLIPAPRWRNQLSYQLSQTGNWQDLQVSLTGLQVWQQNRVPSAGELAPPPDGYFLLNAQVSGRWINGPHEWQVFFRVENLLNTAYRDYLNRLRYFADEPGRNFSLSISYRF